MERIGCTRPSQPLKVPTTLTAERLGPRRRRTRPRPHRPLADARRASRTTGSGVLPAQMQVQLAQRRRESVRIYPARGLAVAEEQLGAVAKGELRPGRNTANSPAGPPAHGDHGSVRLGDHGGGLGSRVIGPHHQALHAFHAKRMSPSRACGSLASPASRRWIIARWSPERSPATRGDDPPPCSPEKPMTRMPCSGLILLAWKAWRAWW